MGHTEVNHMEETPRRDPLEETSRSKPLEGASEWGILDRTYVR